MSTLYDTIVIGGGPAGLSAALNAKLEGFNTLVVERASWGGRAAQSARIDNVLGMMLTGPEFGLRALTHINSQGVHRLNADVHKVVPGRVYTSEGVRFARSIIIATGAQWRELEIPGLREAIESGLARYGCDTITDASRVAGKHIAILGGANSAGINALHFATACDARSVAMFVRSDLSGMSFYLREALLATKSIWPLIGEELVGVDKVGDTALALRTSRGEGAIEVSHLFLFPDALPQTGFVECEKDPRGFLTCDEHLQTSLEGVFACGDVREGTTKRIASAIGDGATVVTKLKKWLQKGCVVCAA